MWGRPVRISETVYCKLLFWEVNIGQKFRQSSFPSLKGLDKRGEEFIVEETNVRDTDQQATVS